MGKKPLLGHRKSFCKKKALQVDSTQRAAPVYLDPLAAFPFVTSRRFSNCRQSRSSDSRIILSSAPSHSCYLNSGIFADLVPDYSGGTAPDFHGIPLKLFIEHLADIFY